ncbi:MAG: 4a-hydroxytetrahydrobiopterin dehydratase [Pseudomonadota bacterium]
MSDFEIYEGEKLENWLSTNSQWIFIDGEIKADYKFSNFIEAFGFLSKVAITVEKHNHHPRIENTYNRVTLSMHTHDAGNKITHKDIELAEAIDAL